MRFMSRFLVDFKSRKHPVLPATLRVVLRSQLLKGVHPHLYKPYHFLHLAAAKTLTGLQPRVLEDSNLVDPASSHMLVSKTKPCMSKYKCYTAKLRMAH